MEDSTTQPMEASLNPTPTPVPTDKWLGTVKLFIKRLGKPALTPPSDEATDAAIEAATVATWGQGESGARLEKVARGVKMTPSGSNIFFHCRSQEEYDASLRDLKELYPEEVDNEITTINEYKNPLIGPVNVKVTTFSAFYVNKDQSFLKNSDVLGAVGHNPPPD